MPEAQSHHCSSCNFDHDPSKTCAEIVTLWVHECLSRIAKLNDQVSQLNHHVHNDNMGEPLFPERAHMLKTKSAQLMRCKCGHRHLDHGPSNSINYTAGVCRIAKCDCEHFLMA